MTAAILFLLLCNLLYAIGYALAKILAAELDPLQITFLRSALVLLGAVGLSLRLPDIPGAWLHALAPPRPWAQRLCGAVLIGSTTMGVIAYWLVPVTEAAALGFTGPILLVAMGGLLLREPVGAKRWIAVLLGFAGMLLVVRPGVGVLRWEALVPIASALTYSLYQVMTRRLRGVADARDAMVQGAIAGVVLLGVVMPLLWRPLDARLLALVVVFTAVQTAALGALAAAVRRAEVSALAPWHYCRLLFALAIDAAMFDRWPPASAIAGGVLITAGGLLLLRK